MGECHHIHNYSANFLCQYLKLITFSTLQAGSCVWFLCWCHVWDAFNLHAGFEVFWASKISWLSMTFSITSPSFPWPFKLTIFLEIIFYFGCVHTIFFTKKPSFIKYFFKKRHDFSWPTLKIPCLFRPGKWHSKILWLSRSSMTCTNPVVSLVWVKGLEWVTKPWPSRKFPCWYSKKQKQNKKRKAARRLFVPWLVISLSSVITKWWFQTYLDL